MDTQASKYNIITVEELQVYVIEEILSWSKGDSTELSIDSLNERVSKKLKHYNFNDPKLQCKITDIIQRIHTRDRETVWPNAVNCRIPLINGEIIPTKQNTRFKNNVVRIFRIIYSFL